MSHPLNKPFLATILLIHQIAVVFWVEIASDLLKRKRWLGTDCGELPSTVAKVKHQQVSKVVADQDVLQHQNFQLGMAPSRQGLVFQSHVSTCRFQVGWVDSVAPSEVLHWVRILVGVAKSRFVCSLDDLVVVTRTCL